MKYALAKAYLTGRETMYWTNAYERMQTAAGHEPRTESFFRMIDSIRNSGFDPAHPIPVDINYNVLDGTHRLASCLALRTFPKVEIFKGMAKQFGMEWLAMSTPDEIRDLEKVRQELLLDYRAPYRGEVVATVWGVSLPLWDKILSFLGHGNIRRAFQRRCDAQDYAKLIALTYAGDGISDKSLHRKIWMLSKFTTALGIVLLDIPQAQMTDVKLSLRDYIVPQTTAYHYDSVIHTIDKEPYAGAFFNIVQPYKPVGTAVEIDEFSRKLVWFFDSTASKNVIFRKPEIGPDGQFLDIEASAAMQINNRFKLVIFDLDGVLIDSERISVSAYLTIIENAG